MDSAAEESACPKNWAGASEMKLVVVKKIRSKNASGGEIRYLGSKEVKFRSKSCDNVVSMGIQASDTQKSLAGLWRISEQGNVV